MAVRGAQWALRRDAPEYPSPGPCWWRHCHLRNTGDTPAWKLFDGFLHQHRLESTWSRYWLGDEWLAGTFSVADILMADGARRLVDRFDGLADYPACRTYVARATAARPS